MVAVLLYQHVTRSTHHHLFNAWHYHTIPLWIVYFLYVTIVSVGIGLICGKNLNSYKQGVLCTLICKNIRFFSHNPTVESSVVIIFGFVAYLACETIEFSGVISVLFCGIFLGHYNYYNLSLKGQHATKFLL